MSIEKAMETLERVKAVHIVVCKRANKFSQKITRFDDETQHTDGGF